jgi:hypothetical protein
MIDASVDLPSFWFSHSLVGLTFSAFLVYFVFRAIYLLFLSPLSVIPGPWYAAISDFWLTTHVVRLQQCKIIHDLLETYGPVVRVGPNKVVFRDLHSAKNVYSIHKFDKSAYYQSLLTYVQVYSARLPSDLTHLTTFQQRQQSRVRPGCIYARDYADIHVIQYDNSRTRFSCYSSQRIRPPLYGGQSGALPASNSRFHHGTHQCMYASLLYHLDGAADGRHRIDTRRLRWQNFFGLSHLVPSLHGRHYCLLF